MGWRLMGRQNLDFVDCILYAYNKVKGYEIKAFDKSGETCWKEKTCKKWGQQDRRYHYCPDGQDMGIGKFSAMGVSGLVFPACKTAQVENKESPADAKADAVM